MSLHRGGSWVVSRSSFCIKIPQPAPEARRQARVEATCFNQCYINEYDSTSISAQVLYS